MTTDFIPPMRVLNGGRAKSNVGYYVDIREARRAFDRYETAYRLWVQTYNDIHVKQKRSEGENVAGDAKIAKKQPLRRAHAATFERIIVQYARHMEKVCQGLIRKDAPFKISATGLTRGVDARDEASGDKLAYSTIWRHIARLKEAGIIESHGRDPRSGVMTLKLNLAVTGLTWRVTEADYTATAMTSTIAPPKSSTASERPVSWFNVAKCATSSVLDTKKSKLPDKGIGYADNQNNDYSKRHKNLNKKIRGHVDDAAKIAAENAFNFAMLLLYSNKPFAAATANEAQAHIKSFFAPCQNRKQVLAAYMQFCGRITLRRHYLDRTGAVQMNPAIYFNPDLPNHFVYTGMMWRKQLALERQYSGYISRYKRLAIELGRFMECAGGANHTWAYEQAEQNLGRIKGDDGWFLEEFRRVAGIISKKKLVNKAA